MNTNKKKTPTVSIRFLCFADSTVCTTYALYPSKKKIYIFELSMSFTLYISQLHIIYINITIEIFHVLCTHVYVYTRGGYTYQSIIILK